MAYKPKAGIKVKLKKQKLIWKYGGLDANGVGGFWLGYASTSSSSLRKPSISNSMNIPSSGMLISFSVRPGAN